MTGKPTNRQIGTTESFKFCSIDVLFSFLNQIQAQCTGSDANASMTNENTSLFSLPPSYINPYYLQRDLQHSPTASKGRMIITSGLCRAQRMTRKIEEAFLYLFVIFSKIAISKHVRPQTIFPCLYCAMCHETGWFASVLRHFLGMCRRHTIAIEQIMEQPTWSGVMNAI